MNKVFDASFGITESEAFLAWSDNYVYFCAMYDGAQWVERVLRNPCKILAHHVGG